MKIYLGEEFTAKDFRTWGGSLLAAICFAEEVELRGFPESETEQKRSVTAVMRRVAKQLGNTPAVTRESYVSPAVVDHYLDGRTIADFRPCHLRVVKARESALSPEEEHAGVLVGHVPWVRGLPASLARSLFARPKGHWTYRRNQ
ncbi:MAG TPA: hypothetical protein VKO84_08235 [Gaiellaceae bacterium]|nr:hypothetical protein [Gaiellaceae bacterium]